MAASTEIEELRQKTLDAEKNMGGAQVTWASVPKTVPLLRRKSILFSGVVGQRRQYAFASDTERELFVYDRHDTLFTVSRDIRVQLGLTPPTFKGSTVVRSAQEEAPPKPPEEKKNRFRK